MSKVVSKNAALFNHPVDEIYRTVTDFTNYSRWYPKPFKIEIRNIDSHIIGTTLSIKNGPFVKWLAKVTKFEPNQLIAIDYIDGAWIGNTYWRFEDQNGKTKLSLEIDLEINKTWLRLLSKFVDFSNRHTKQMHEVFVSLEHYLKSGEREY